MKVDSSTTFSQVYDRFKTKQNYENYGGSKHLRFDPGSSKALHIKQGFSFGDLLNFLKSRKKKQAKLRAGAGPQIWKSLANQHGKDVADAVFKNVLNYKKGDHRADITFDDMDRIKAALPETKRELQLQDAAQDAAELYCADRPTSDDLQGFFSKHLDDLSSKAFYDTEDFRHGEAQFRVGLAFAHLDRMFDPNVGLNRNDREWFRTALDLDEHDQATMPSPDRPDEEVKKWMLDKMEQQFFKPGGKHEINFNDNRQQTRFHEDYQQLETVDEKLNALKSMYSRKVISGDVQEIAQRAHRAVIKMQHPTMSRTALVQKADAHIQSEQLHSTGRNARIQKQRLSQEHLRSLQLGAKNKKTIRSFLPGHNGYNRVVKKFGWDPAHVLTQERKYISDRLYALAKVKAEAGHELTHKEAGKALKGMLKELNKDQNAIEFNQIKAFGQTDADEIKPSLPLLHDRALGAADQLLKGLTSTPPASPQESMKNVMEFYKASLAFSKARDGGGGDGIIHDMKFFMANAARHMGDLSHVDIIANIKPLLFAARLADADSRVMEDGLSQAALYTSLIANEMFGAIVNSVAQKQGKLELIEQFNKLDAKMLNVVDRAAGDPMEDNYNFKLSDRSPIPERFLNEVGADSSDSIYDAADEIFDVTKPLVDEAAKRYAERSGSNRHESVSSSV